MNAKKDINQLIYLDKKTTLPSNRVVIEPGNPGGNSDNNFRLP